MRGELSFTRILFLIYKIVRAPLGLSFAFVLMYGIFTGNFSSLLLLVAFGLFLTELFAAIYNDYCDYSEDIRNKRTDKIPPGAIYVGRPSKWGNPMTVAELKRLFPLDSQRERNEKAVAWSHRYLFAIGNYELLSSVKELKGKDLICWCAPLPCHADVLLEVANAKSTS